MKHSIGMDDAQAQHDRAKGWSIDAKHTTGGTDLDPEEHANSEVGLEGTSVKAIPVKKARVTHTGGGKMSGHSY